MHKEILTKKQSELLSLIKLFSKNFGLVGGTAIALQLGHRQSIDFDLFSDKRIDNVKIRKKIVGSQKKIKHVFRDDNDEYTILIDDVKFTFLYYPFKIKFSKKFEDTIKLPDLLTLAAMKAYALGRRAKWKDYVDLYFILQNFHTIDKIIKQAKIIFKQEFNEKIFRSQLAYFKDIDYSERIIYIENSEIKNTIIKQELTKFSLQ